MNHSRQIITFLKNWQEVGDEGTKDRIGKGGEDTNPNIVWCEAKRKFYCIYCWPVSFSVKALFKPIGQSQPGFLLKRHPAVNNVEEKKWSQRTEHSLCKG